MKQIELISMGQLKFNELQKMEEHYSRKINHFVKFTSRGLKDIKVQDEAKRKQKEGEAMLPLLDKRDFVIALDQYGKKMSSPTFAELISEKMSYGCDRLVFLIGGHSGLAKELDPHISMKISFSDMVFAHDLFRIVFLEQLYRAFTIIKGIKYHR